MIDEFSRDSKEYTKHYTFLGLSVFIHRKSTYYKPSFSTSRHRESMCYKHLGVRVIMTLLEEMENDEIESFTQIETFFVCIIKIDRSNTLQKYVL